MKNPDILIIEKTLNNEASKEDADVVVRWFKTEKGQKWLSERMDEDEATLEIGREDNWVDHPIPSAQMYNIITNHIKKRKIRHRLLYAAAILLPMILFVSLFIQVNTKVDLFASEEYDVISVPKGERLQVLFQDGSKACLNAGSSIRYPKKFGLFDRKVFLEGEAWFQVEKNKNRPFIVDVSAVKVHVTGTSFNVKAYKEDNKISVALESGSVEIESSSCNTYQLKPGDKAIFDKQSGICKIFRDKEVEMYSAWKVNRLFFRETSVSEVLKTLSRTYNVEFVIKDPAIYRYSCTLIIDTTDINLALTEIETIAPIRFERHKEIIEVYYRK